MTKVSILIPVYNASKYLKGTLNSVVNQTLTDFEVIIVNDGSTDKSEEIIDSFVQKYDFIKKYNKENSGVADTRNYALTKATGNYIGFVDSDDEVDPNMFKEMYDIAVLNNRDVVICGFEEIHEHFTAKKSGLFHNDIENKLLHPPCLWNKLIKRELFDNNIFPKITIGEDMVATIKILNKTDNIDYINKYFYKYYKRTNSLMNQKKYKEYWNDIFVVFSLLEKELENNKEELEYLFIQHILRDSSIKFMYYNEGKEALNIIKHMIKYKYPNFKQNKYYKKEKFRYRFICNLLYHRQYLIVKIIRKILNSDR